MPTIVDEEGHTVPRNVFRAKRSLSRTIASPVFVGFLSAAITWNFEAIGPVWAISTAGLWLLLSYAVPLFGVIAGSLTAHIDPRLWRWFIGIFASDERGSR